MLSSAAPVHIHVAAKEDVAVLPWEGLHPTPPQFRCLSVQKESRRRVKHGRLAHHLTPRLVEHRHQQTPLPSHGEYSQLLMCVDMKDGSRRRHMQIFATRTRHAHYTARRDPLLGTKPIVRRRAPHPCAPVGPIRLR